jgi:DNA-binding NarL/FixJ family response regulator
VRHFVGPTGTFGDPSSEPAGQTRGESVSDALIGRGPELTLLGTLVRDAAPARPTLIEVVGDPGVGKSRLLRETARTAREHTETVLSVTALPRPEPDAMTVSLLRHLGTAPGSRPAHALEAALRERSAAGTPVVLLVDDLHLADPSSVDSLRHLLGSGIERLVVAIGYRPRQSGPALTGLLAGLPEVRQESIPLGGLSAGELCCLLKMPPGPHITELHELCLGVPLYALAYRPLMRHRPHMPTGDLAGSLPLPVIRLLERELAALEPDERQVLQAAAVLGDGCDPALVADVIGMDRQRGARIVDQLVTLDLLRPDYPAGPSLRFRHEVVRAAVYRATEPSQLRRMHDVSIKLLRDLGHSPAAYAEHVARSAMPGDLDAARTVLDAARDARVGPETAASWLSMIRRLPADEVEAGLRFAIEIELAEALLAAGRLDDCRALLDQLAGGAPADGYECGRIALVSLRLERLRGRPREALAVVREELAHGSQPVRLRILMATEAATCATLCGMADQAVEYAGLAADTLDRMQRDATVPAGISDPLLTARVRAAQAFVAGIRGDMAALDEHVRLAVEVVDRLPDSGLSDGLDLLFTIGLVERFREREREALRHFDRGVHIAGMPSRSPHVPYLLIGRSWSAIRLGDLERARRGAIEAEELLVALGMTAVTGFARAIRADALAWQAGPAAARAVLEPLLAEASAGDRDFYREHSQRVAIRLRQQSDDEFDATASLLRHAGGDDLAWIPACRRGYWATVLADLARVQGDHAAATRWVEEAERHARRLGLSGQSAHAARARAELSMATGAPGAVEASARAVASFADLGWLLDEAVARTVHAATLDASRRWRDAEVALGSVRRIADLTGARMLQHTVVNEQRRIVGRAGRAVPGQQPVRQRPALTRREWDIVQLVAAGVSNTEVADRLFVTVKTVEAHLTRIFRKLGVTSRVGLVVALNDLPDRP